MFDRRRRSMSTREGLEPSRSQDSDIQDPDTQTRPIPPRRPQDADTPSDQPWPPSWGQASPSWGQAPAAPAAPERPDPVAASSPTWTPPPAAQGPSWTQPKGPEAQADQG